MKMLDIVELLLLSMLWGASFLFMRMAAPEFGPIALVSVRVFIGALFLVPILLWRKGTVDVANNIKPIFVVGMLNTAIPFCLFAYATLSLTAGFSSVLNATSPLWTALVAIFYLKERLSSSAKAGLVIGFTGVVIMVWSKLVIAESNFINGIVAGLFAAFLYGVAALYSKRHLANVNPLAIATGSLLCASLVLLPLSYIYWPEHEITHRAWLAVLILAIASTAFAYLLYFRLVKRLGPSKAITVTYLVPVFGMLFGSVFLNEVVTGQMLAGCGLILLGTSLATGVLEKQPKIFKRLISNKRLQDGM